MIKENIHTHLTKVSFFISVCVNLLGVRVDSEAKTFKEIKATLEILEEERRDGNMMEVILCGVAVDQTMSMIAVA